MDSPGFDLSSKVAIVTGGASGLGRAICDGLCAGGSRLALLDRDAERGTAVVKELRERYPDCSARFIPCDVTQEQQVTAAFEELANELGSPDILINSAGINRAQPAQELSLDDWNAILSVNLTGTFLTCRSFGRYAIPRGRGAIVNIASMSGIIVNRGRHNSAYCAAKGGVIMYTKALVSEWARYGIRANAIAPGYFRTPFNEKWIADPEMYERALNNTPLHRIGEPPEIVPLVLLLVSDAASFITGAVYSIDGGYTVW